MQNKILIYFFLSSYYFVALLNAIEISAASFFSQKVVKCYNCSSLYDDDCKYSTNVIKNPHLVAECRPGAQGCVKQFVKRFDGKNATFRECYYGSISPFFKNFACEDSKRNRQYDVVQCYKCKGDLCNNSNSLRSKSGIILYTLTAAISTFIFRM